MQNVEDGKKKDEESSSYMSRVNSSMLVTNTPQKIDR